MTVLIAGSNNSILSTTWANKPASYPVGQSVFISNAGTKGSHWFYDGTRWKPLNGIATLATLDTASANIGSTETIVLQCLIPAGLWQTNDRIRIYCVMAKSGTTDAGTLRVRIGTSGTTADTALLNNTGQMSASIRASTSIQDWRLASATSADKITQANNYGYSGGTGTPYQGTITISSASANPLYCSLSIASGGTTDTVQIIDAQFQIISSAN